MKYMALIYVDPEYWNKLSQDEQNAVNNEYMTITQDFASKGVMVAGEALQPPNTATTVRVREGKGVITDGPFAETKEYLGGFYIFDCKNLDEALELASKIPDVRSGGIEVRPVMEINM